MVEVPIVSVPGFGSFLMNECCHMLRLVTFWAHSSWVTGSSLFVKRECDHERLNELSAFIANSLGWSVCDYGLLNNRPCLQGVLLDHGETLCSHLGRVDRAWADALRLASITELMQRIEQFFEYLIRPSPWPGVCPHAHALRIPSLPPSPPSPPSSPSLPPSRSLSLLTFSTFSVP